MRTYSDSRSRKDKRAEHEARTGLVATMALLGWKCVRWTDGGAPNAFARRLRALNEFPQMRVASAPGKKFRVELDLGETRRLTVMGDLKDFPVYRRLDRYGVSTSPTQLAIKMNSEISEHGCDYFTESENFAGDQRTVLRDDPVQLDRGRKQDFAKWQAIVDRCHQRD